MVDTQALHDVLKAHWMVDTQAAREAIKALWTVDHSLFGEAWDERLAAAVGRLETRAEGILTAPPEPELKTVEALSADMGAVIEAAPAEAREDTKTWLTWLLVFLVDAIAGDPAKEALRHALMKLLVVLFVMITDPTLPTPPPAPALQQPDALAPVSAPAEALILPGGWEIEGLPDIVLRAGPQAAERTVEFFTAQIRNPHTRAAYGTAVTRFFTWCDARGLALAQISPIAVATYIDEMHGRYRAPTIKQHLAAIRRLFDWLVIGQVIPTNPAASVRGPTHVVRTGKTPVLQPAEARLLLDTIDTATLRGLRDRALLGVMVYSFARVSCVRRRTGHGRAWPSRPSSACAWRTTTSRASAGGCGSRKKAGSTTPYRSTTRRRPISTPISPRPGSRPRKTRPCGARCRGRAGSARAG